MAGAAIFDLDRTVIPGSFVLGTFGAAVDDRSLLGVALRMATGWFEQRGESRTSAVLSRTALNMLTPLAPSRLRTLGERAAVRVEPFEWVNEALERHRAAGETTVLTSAGPADLCKPFAETLGFDAVIATEVRDGVIDGHFVWGKGKASAVHHWMIDNGRSLSESTAYSHSVFDLPLLDSVGCPVAVNPDERLAATAADRGWVMIEPVSQSRAMPLDLQQLVVPWIRNEFNPFCVVELDTFAAASEGAFLVEFEVDAAATLVEAVCVIAALSRAMGRGVYVAVPKWLMSTPLLGGLAAVLGAVPDVDGVIDRLLRAGHAVARLAPPGADALSLCVEPVIATFERTATSNEALRPVVRPTFMNSLPAGDAIS